MSTKHAAAIAAAMAIAVLASCNRNGNQGSQTAAPASAPAPAQPLPPAVPPPAAPPPIPASTELPVDSVESVIVSRPADAPMAIDVHVTGMTASAGWTMPKLAPDESAEGDAGVRTYRFVATSPAQPGGERTATPVEAFLHIDMLPAEVKTIRVVGGTNEVSAAIAQ